MMDTEPFYKRPAVWRRVIVWGLFGWFLFLFRTDIFLFLSMLRGALTSWSIPLIEDQMLLSTARFAANILVYTTVFFSSLFIVAQFVLPVHGWTNRLKAFERLLLFLTPWRGPAVFVREGRLIKRIGEEDNGNPGVALVDLRSAIILEQEYPWGEIIQDQDQTEHNGAKEKRRIPFFAKSSQDQAFPYVRVGGPGVHFTEYGEKIRDVVDLRRQVRTESEVKAFTRDGIELQTNVFAVFSLSDPPDVIPVAYVGGRSLEHLFALEMVTVDKNFIKIKAKHELDPEDAEEIHKAVEAGLITPTTAGTSPQTPLRGKSPYVFDEQRVFAAVYGQAQRSLPEKNLKWDELPQLIAAELFRDLLEQYPYDYLYKLDDPKTLPWLNEIKPKLSRKLMYQGLLSYKMVRPAQSRFAAGSARVPNWNEDPLNENLFAHPFHAQDLEMSLPRDLTTPKPLRDRGIKSVAAGFTDLKVSEDIKMKMVERWKARWEREIAFARAKQEREAMQVINTARTQTQRDSTYFLSNMLKQEKHSKEALALLLFQALETAATDEKGYKDFPPKEVLNMLQSLHRWLLTEHQDFEHKKKAHKLEGHSVPPANKEPKA
ncbi:MAG: hypothetical protein HY869_21125 [Chloroflexi bacterium]|nr:hypothetical protein [Chloroflexota bacterium]